MHTFRAFQGLSINEFSGLQFDHQHSFDIRTGEQVRVELSIFSFQFELRSGLIEMEKERIYRDLWTSKL